MPHIVPGSRPPRPSRINQDVQNWFLALPFAGTTERLSSRTRSLPTPRNRLHDPDRMNEADGLILAAFQEAGWKARREPFSFSGVPGFIDYGSFGPTLYPTLQGVNVVAYRDGHVVPSEAIVVIAHHDTIRDSPGANDNTASVAALLELARVLSPSRFARTIVLAATDMEELGFFGSRALVSSLARSHRVKNAINYETMAYTSSEPKSQFLPPGLGLIYASQVKAIRDEEFRGAFTTVIYRGSSTECAAHFAAGLAFLAGPRVPLLLRDPNDLPVVGTLLARTIPFVRQFARSDHVPFWEAGFPAIQITDTANFRYPHYHQPTDTAEKLDYTRVSQIVGATAIAIASEAGLLLG